MKRVVVFLTVIAISLTFLVFSIERNAYNKSYYLKKYEENNIETVTGKSNEELENITEKLILYLKGGENDLLRPHFNEKEILHMEDVKGLFNIARLIKYIGILIIVGSLIYFLKIKKMFILSRGLFYGLFSNHVLITIIATLAFIDFNKYFNYFHHIFFTNDLWILNPKTDLMIQMLPENFFFGMATNIMIYFLVYISLIQLISYLHMKRNAAKYKVMLFRSLV